MESIIRRLLFTLEPERAHHIAQQLMRLRAFLPSKKLQSETKAFGLTFPNPIGLAAGWDKNALCFEGLFRLGFGFVEVGTVTPKPQPGNEKPRLFRIPEKKALINRMGFNNAGVDALVEKIKNRRAPGILGVNIGKNKDTSLENAVEDYQHCLKAVFPYADYVVINISSPNTPGLRDLQSTTYLNDLLMDMQRLKKQLSGQYNRELPMLVKTTIDFPEADLQQFVQALLDCSIDGLVISNTTIDHSSIADSTFANEAGGLSGAPLREKVSQRIQKVNEMSEGELPIIGVGGILAAQDAKAHLDAGASLIQLYTGFVYQGSTLLNNIFELISHK